MRTSIKRLVSFLLIVTLAVAVSFCTRPEAPTPGEQQTEIPTDTPSDTPDKPDGPDDPDIPGGTDDPDGPDDPETPDVIHVSDLTIGPDEDIVLEVGQTRQLTCTISPDNAADKSFRWSSDHPEFVTVDDKGLVKAIAVGEAQISAIATDGGVTASKLVTVYRPQPQAFTYITITAPAADDSHTVVGGASNHDMVLRFSPGETFQLQAKGTPEDANDEVEFLNATNSLGFDVTPDGFFKATSGCGMLNSNDYRNHYVLVRSKKNPKVSAKYFIQVTGSNTKRIAIIDASVPYHFVHPEGIVLPLRYSQYIGKGVTRVFAVYLETADGGYRAVNSNFSIVSSSGPVSFVKDGNRWKATVNTNASVCSPNSTVEASVTIKVNGGERTIPFLVCQYDPLYPKLGDGLCADKEGYLDGGYRGNGVFEAPPYSSDVKKANVMIAYLGNIPYDYDPIYKNYCAGGISTGDVEYHGIAIPVNTGRLYRSSNPNGEKFSDDRDNLFNSDAWPKWFKDSKNNVDHTGLISIHSGKASAFANTSALVFRNRFCGSSHDVKPANFFVNTVLLAPSESQEKVEISDFSWESDFYGDMTSGNWKSTSDAFNAKTLYSDRRYIHTPWLLPTLVDMSLILGVPIDASSLTTTAKEVTVRDSRVLDQLEVFQTCGKYFSGVKPTYDYAYWLSQSSSQGATAPRLTISNGFVITVKLELKDQNRAYVLPIAYF